MSTWNIWWWWWWWISRSLPFQQKKTSKSVNTGERSEHLSIKYIPVLSQKVLCYSEQSCTILSNPVLSWAILFYPVLSWPILYYPVWEILYCPVVSWPILCYIVQSSAIPSNPVLSHTILSQSPYHYNYVISYLYVQLTHNDTKKSNAIFSNVVTLMSIW